MQNADFVVSETISYAFSGQYNRAFRTIPYNRFSSLTDWEVWEGNQKYEFAGAAELDKTLSPSWGKYIVYHKDNADTIYWYFNALDQTRTFTIKYIVHGGIGNFIDHDELYWNTISAERAETINNVEVTVKLPKPTDQPKMQIRLLTDGGTDNQSQIFEGQTFHFSGKNFGANTNFTVVCGWPIGLIEGPLLAEREAKQRQDELMALLVNILIGIDIAIPFITFFIMFWLWWTRGRDMGGKRSIAPEFAPPTKGFLPGMVETLFKEQSSMTAITATIVDLARKRYLTIYEEENKGLFGLGAYKDYRFELESERPRRKKDVLSDYEREVIARIFGGLTSKKTSELRNVFYRDIPVITKIIDLAVFSNFPFFVDNDPKKTRKKYYVWGWIIFALGFLSFLLTWGALVLAGVIIILFGRLMGRRTLEGRIERDRWLGFKMFLAKAEHFGYSDKVTQEVFEEYLPFAIIFGVQKEWAARFADLKFEQPDWYHGTAAYASYALFSDSFSSMISSTSSSMSVSPSSSSGFGGGGSAGGGGGGGGSGAD